MPKRRKQSKTSRRTPGRSRTERRVVPRKQMSIQAEARHVVRCAQNRETHVVSLPPLLFFSAETGDAWVLDPEDHFAMQLAQDGASLPFTIQESRTRFRIDWAALFDIRGDVFSVLYRTGRARAITGYPVEEIQQAIRRMQTT